MGLLERDNRVCVEIKRYKPDLSEYEFVVMQGTLRVVTDSEERLRSLNGWLRKEKVSFHPISWLLTASTHIKADLHFPLRDLW